MTGRKNKIKNAASTTEQVYARKKKCVMRCGAVWCGAVWCGLAWCALCVVWYGAVQILSKLTKHKKKIPSPSPTPSLTTTTYLGGSE